jgi:hypothetical protein
MDINTLLLIIVILAQAVLALTKLINKPDKRVSEKNSPSNGNGNNGRKPYHYVIPGSGEKCIQHEGRIIKLEEQNQRGREDYQELKREMNVGFTKIYQKLDALK